MAIRGWTSRVASSEPQVFRVPCTVIRGTQLSGIEVDQLPGEPEHLSFAQTHDKDQDECLAGRDDRQVGCEIAEIDEVVDGLVLMAGNGQARSQPDRQDSVRPSPLVKSAAPFCQKLTIVASTR